MATLLSMLSILLTSILVNNVVLAKYLGICSFLGLTKKLDAALGMSYAVIFVLVLSTAVTWPIQKFLLDPNGLGYLQTIVFILVIAGLVQFIEFIIKKFMPSLYSALGVFLPLITTNCAVLGVCILNMQANYGFAESIVNALGTGIGYLIAMVLFNGVRTRMEDAEGDFPKCFKGVPITLAAASIVAMSFGGFGGIVENIFK
ncbi:MAG: RnfABCDGE type electron transport complex subunit A [Oscillospiraceae bacterium]